MRYHRTLPIDSWSFTEEEVKNILLNYIYIQGYFIHNKDDYLICGLERHSEYHSPRPETKVTIRSK